MKNYSPKTAARLQVRPQVAHGLSRHHQRAIADRKVTSIGTERSHVSALTVFAKWLLSDSGKHLKNATAADAIRYLTERSKTVRQKTLDLDRQALNMNFRFPSKLKYVLSEISTCPKDRAYTKSQLSLLLDRAPAALRLSIELSVYAGLRSMELITIAPQVSLLPSDRVWHSSRFDGRAGDESFTVHGKGGLRREVKLNVALASRLVEMAHHEPLRVTHRETHLASYFDLIGGHAFCSKFGRLSKSVLGFSHGAHGLRHSFAQDRYLQLVCRGHDPTAALEILAQEMGHFSVTNTLTYLSPRFALHAEHGTIQ
jgi:integrase